MIVTEALFFQFEKQNKEQKHQPNSRLLISSFLSGYQPFLAICLPEPVYNSQLIMRNIFIYTFLWTWHIAKAQ